MSPISSSRCLVGKYARSATLRTISAYPSSGRRLRGQANCTPCGRPAPLSTCGAARWTARQRRWYRGAIVRGGGESCSQRAAHAGGPTASGVGGAGAACRQQPVAVGCGGGARQDAHEPKGTLRRCRSCARASRQLQAIARPDRAGTGGAQQRHAHGAERGGHGRLLLLHRKLSRTGCQQAPVWAIEQGPGAIARSARREPGGEQAGRRARRRTSTRGRSARWRPAQTRTFLWLSCR